MSHKKKRKPEMRAGESSLQFLAKGENGAVLSMVLNHLQVGVHLIDSDFNLLFANRWSIEKLQSATFPQGKCFEVLFKRKTPCKECPFAGRGIDSCSTLFYFHSSKERTLRVTVTGISPPAGEVAIIETVEDVSSMERLKRRIDQLQRLEKATAYARDLAHDFNQPLTGIAGLASLILEDIESGSEHYENIKELEKQAIRLRELIQKLQNLF